MVCFNTGQKTFYMYKQFSFLMCFIYCFKCIFLEIYYFHNHLLFFVHCVSVTDLHSCWAMITQLPLASENVLVCFLWMTELLTWHFQAHGDVSVSLLKGILSQADVSHKTLCTSVAHHGFILLNNIYNSTKKWNFMD